MLRCIDSFSELLQLGCQTCVFDWRMKKVRDGNSSRESQCWERPVMPWYGALSPYRKEVLANLRIMKPNTKLLFHVAWGFHLGRDRDCGSYRKQVCVRVRGHHKQRRWFCEAVCSLMLLEVPEVGYTHRRGAVGGETRLSLKSIQIVKFCEESMNNFATFQRFFGTILVAFS